MATHFTRPAIDYEQCDLHDLIERLQAEDPGAIYECVVFTLQESFGSWHNRARAKICRILKNRLTDRTLQSRLVEVIVQRLASGRFSQQFKDQLRLASRFDPDRMRTAAERLQSADLQYVRRYADWTLQHLDAVSSSRRSDG